MTGETRSPESVHRSDTWTTVFAGSMSEVLIRQGLLESNGVPTHILDQNIKVMDPFLTGANALTVQLQIPVSRLEEAREMLAWRPPRILDDEEPRAPDAERLEKLGNRIRWASITILTAPYALLLAPSYLLGASRMSRKPRNHGWTVAALLFAGALTFVVLGIWLGRR